MEVNKKKLYSQRVKLSAWGERLSGVNRRHLGVMKKASRSLLKSKYCYVEVEVEAEHMRGWKRVKIGEISDEIVQDKKKVDNVRHIAAGGEMT